jgi:hypothetical protein
VLILNLPSDALVIVIPAEETEVSDKAAVVSE